MSKKEESFLYLQRFLQVYDETIAGYAIFNL